MRKTDILRDIAVSMVLLTRLPMPRLPASAFDRQAQAAWAFPLAGLAVAVPACAIAAAAMAVGLPGTIAAGLLLGVQVLLTGAMHEDGLADVADGFWGGFTPEARLAIMKDSRIGAYGVLALIFFVGLRWMAVAALLEAGAIAAIIATALLSRAPLPALMTVLRPARSDGLAQGVGAPGRAAAITAVLLAAGSAVALLGPVALLPASIAAATSLAVARLAMAKIGGQTGDVLGATQVAGETALLLTWVTLV